MHRIDSESYMLSLGSENRQSGSTVSRDHTTVQKEAVGFQDREEHCVKQKHIDTQDIAANKREYIHS